MRFNAAYPIVKSIKPSPATGKLIGFRDFLKPVIIKPPIVDVPSVEDSVTGCLENEKNDLKFREFIPKGDTR